MAVKWILLILFCIAAGAFLYGRGRAMSLARTGLHLHSRPVYHGINLAVCTTVPALIVALLWSLASPSIVHRSLLHELPAEMQQQSPDRQALALSVIGNIARGLHKLDENEYSQLINGNIDLQSLFMSKGVLLGSGAKPYMVGIADKLNSRMAVSGLLQTAVISLLVLAGFAYGRRNLLPHRRARNAVERLMLIGLIAASTVAILTTIGIVLSVVFETLHFFKSVPPADFFFGTVWDPRFSAPGRIGGAEGQFGLIPLLWGTLYISLVALLVAVPIGLYSAIYMSEYASERLRAVVKPLLEVLAGIPTIVYGFFALVTFGPFLRSVGAIANFDISPSSVLTAGIVMGIMIIPFVSSLSDDIISAVPQSLREGAYGLGSTQSETIKQVILPAALPGVVGAVLLAASRAIGETMIVVLAAGIAANMTFNPAETVTTITVKIVSQLTGDLEFDSPQTLVAFALGLTLFVVTLGLNVVALYIVRKYREQYE